MKNNIAISIVIYFALFLFGTAGVSANQKSSDLPVLMVFYSPACHSCIKVKSEIMPVIEMESKDRFSIEYRNIEEIENFKLLLSLKEKHNVELSNDMPVFYFEGNFLNGETDIENNWEAFISRSLHIVGTEKMQDLPQIDLISRFKSFKFFAIVSVGLIDGINPCAFTVIVFFISFLSLQGYIRKELIAIGLCFIFAVFVTYLLIGLGAFGFLYHMKGFWLIAKIINLSIGALAIILGFLTLYDCFKFKRTGKTEGLTLQLPQAIKNQIHKVVGLHYRINKKGEGTTSKTRFFKLILSALITGFLISLLEAVCTGQAYLPIIAFILKTTNLKLQAFAYLVVYNLMFIMPLLIIFTFALLGVTSALFSNVLKRHLLTIKILMAILFFSLGAFLILRV